VTNASDAIGDRDGVIRVSTRCVKVGRHAAEDESDDGTRLELAISDNGCGMTTETQQKVFDPFFTTKSTGRGLGLAVVHGIVRNLDGAVVITSEPDKGATFQILLPCVRTILDDTEESQAAVEEMAGSLPGARVLIVEDEDFLREGVAKMLRRTGMEVLEVADGTSAVELLRDSGCGIDLVLLDMTIPGARSEEILEAASKARPDIRVVLTSAYSRDVIASAIDAPQVRGFIRKPFRVADLVKTLRKALSS